jgi:hypothetical protein
MRAFSTFRALPPHHRRLLVTAVTLVAIVRLALWILPSRIIVRSVRAVGLTYPDGVLPRVDVDAVTWAVEAASRRIPQATCLTQAIAAQLLLRRHGFQSRLCLGVARDVGGGFRAHAWLERNGRVVMGANGVRDFTRLPDLADAKSRPAFGDAP